MDLKREYKINRLEGEILCWLELFVNQDGEYELDCWVNAIEDNLVELKKYGRV